MTHHDCCYHECPQPATIYIGENGNPGTEWICEYHHDKWNADRVRFLADGLPCQMIELRRPKERISMRVKIVGVGHFVTDTRFKFEGAFAKDLKIGDVLGYLDPETLEIFENPQIGQRVAMVVPVSLEDSDLEELYARPDDRPEDRSTVGDETSHNCHK